MIQEVNVLEQWTSLHYMGNLRPLLPGQCGIPNTAAVGIATVRLVVVFEVEVEAEHAQCLQRSKYTSDMDLKGEYSAVRLERMSQLHTREEHSPTASVDSDGFRERRGRGTPARYMKATRYPSRQLE